MLKLEFAQLESPKLSDSSMLLQNAGSDGSSRKTNCLVHGRGDQVSTEVVAVQLTSGIDPLQCLITVSFLWYHICMSVGTLCVQEESQIPPRSSFPAFQLNAQEGQHRI
jgi:hypothetical protein